MSVKLEKTQEQNEVLNNNKKNMLVSASAGSGKTFIMIEYISELVCKRRVPIKDLLVLTFTKAAATEMKERLQSKLKTSENDEFVVEQIDSLSVSNISTIDSFCEKSLKKYANLLGISENFSVCDENLLQKIRISSFEKSFTLLKKERENDYFELISKFKNDKKKIMNVLFEVENLLNSVSNEKEFLKLNIENAENYFDKALNYIFEKVQEEINENLKTVSELHLGDFEYDFCQSLKPVLESKDLISMSDVLEDVILPRSPSKQKIGDDVSVKLASAKKNINDALNIVENLNLSDKESVLEQRNGTFEKVLFKLYDIYIQEEKNEKSKLNILDFSDLEKYMGELSEKENLFDGIKYVFVDEYQDTNRIQERIIKNIAKHCNFVAVGDAKQGIYGFRLASSEIFLQDEANFKIEENANVKYLKENFRSCQRVLSFVNDVFSVCMTKETAGIDYKNTSMLHQPNDFAYDEAKSVYIDVIKNNSDEDEQIVAPIYDVENAILTVKENNKKTLVDIKRRIQEVLYSEIYDKGEFRQCKYSDIAILSRKRSNLFKQLEKYLQDNEIPVISSSRNILLDEPEIQVLLNYLKVALNIDDDICLMSVLMSGLSNINLEKVVSEKTDDKTLCKIVKQSDEFKEFRSNLKDFVFDSHVVGVKNAFLNLFQKTEYRAYVNTKKDFQMLNIFVDKFLDEISKSSFEFDLAGLVNYFENVDICVTPDVAIGENSVLLTTIHNSKGLEYPIVFLIDCDNSLKDSHKKSDLEIDENFGLALKNFDSEENSENVSVKMKAIQMAKAKKNFSDELMIFYVALTRAKNRLYLFGNMPKNLEIKNDIKKCDSYFDLIFYSLQKEYQCFSENRSFENESVSINLIEEIEDIDFKNKQNFENSEINTQIYKKIQNYFDFSYNINENTNFKLKESVTGLNNKNDKIGIEKYSNDMFNFNDDFVETGNAYHLALKTLNFEKISTISDLEKEIENNKKIFKNINNYLNNDILLKNILLLKQFTDNSTFFKEKEFIMKDKISNLIDNSNIDDNIMVQGIVDLFVVKNNEIILIDYKYTNTEKENYLIEKYKGQLKLYKIALENALKMPVKHSFLLSLKNNKLIQVDI